MKYKELSGVDIKKDIDEIREEIDKNSSIVFVYSGAGTLYDYIDALYDRGKGLDDGYLYKFKVCYEKKDLTVSYYEGSGKRSREIGSMSNLLNELDGNNSCKLFVESNDRVQLAFIVQQLIFVDYPLEKIDILLRKEESIADKTKRFKENAEKLRKECETAIARLIALRQKLVMDTDNPIKAEQLQAIDYVLNSCSLIKADLFKLNDIEVKLAVAGSKKAGKSMIVNCFLGQQIAPTSTELATPNNSIYRKSPDGRYHLQLEASAPKVFDTRQQIHDELKARFREAQNDREHKFSLPDMNIGYVTEGNDFFSYTIFDTIFDTAGSDAAGTAHADVAEKAIRKCDVAVFAIDYSKYLTKSEEKYLRRVKEIFMDQNKYYSLIFALNKIDIRYNDTETPKSIIMSVDFIKTRLANICDEYRDCIIFPTCSLEYFNAIEAEKAGVTELDAGNELLISEIEIIKSKYRDKYRDMEALASLFKHAANLEYCHGIKRISYDVFKKDSGMPVLMGYVSYIGRKARDEILNSIALEISGRKRAIQSVLDYIANIEVLINADDEKINKISAIMEDYSARVRDIVSKKYNKDELNDLPENSFLRTFAGDYNKFIELQRESLALTLENTFIVESIHSLIVEAIWKKIEYHKKNNLLIKGHKIDGLLSPADFQEIINQIGKEGIEKAARLAFVRLSKLSGEVKTIVRNRQELLIQESDNCRRLLEKEHINLELLEFEFAVKIMQPGKVMVKVENFNIGLYYHLLPMLKKPFIENIGIGKGKGDLSHKKIDDKNFYYRFSPAKSKSDFLSICETALKPSIKNAVYENDIVKKLRDTMTKSVVDQYMKEIVDELKRSFEKRISIYKSYIERFRQAVDDRDKYKDDLALQNLRKENIKSIGACTKGFMDTWDSIMNM